MIGMGQGDLFDVLIIAVPAVLLFSSIIAALRWTLIGGIIVISEGLFLTFWKTGSVSVLFGLPILASGILFILSWRVGHKLLNKEKRE